MRKALRWLRNGVLGVIGLALILAAAAYARSEWILGKAYKVAGKPVAVPSDHDAIAAGARLARTRGCTGCHGAELQGKMFLDDPMLARIAAPNLTDAVREYSDAELERVIRQGVRPDNRGVVVMPSEMYTVLDDRDVGRLIAYMRSVTPIEGQTRRRSVGPLGRMGLALGKFKPAPEHVRTIPSLAERFPKRGMPTARGAYLARTACTECHGLDLAGGQGVPDLRMAAGYDRDQFVRLMRTGVALGNRELDLMSAVARNRFSHFTDDEIAALHTYLVTRAAN